MFSGYQWMHNRRVFLLFVICCLECGAAIAQTPGSATPLPPPPTVSGKADASSPTPVAQALVPEGVYAQRLIETLKLGAVKDDAKAEELLSSLGIEPKYGWISEYPLTPEVLGELDKDIATASAQEKIAPSTDQAVKLVNQLKSQLGFNVGISPLTASPPTPPAVTKIYKYIDNKGGEHFTDSFESIPTEYRNKAKLISQGSSAPTPGPPPPPDMSSAPPIPSQYAPAPDADTLYDYYQDQGPPIITYYAPPEPYYYLYSWVPYAFWSTGYYYPCFFMLNNFRRQVAYNNSSYWVSHHAGPGNSGANQHRTNEANQNWYAVPGALNGAKAIVGLGQNRATSAITATTAHPNRLPQPQQQQQPHQQLQQQLQQQQVRQHQPQPERNFPPVGGRINNQLYGNNQPERFEARPPFQEQRQFNAAPAFRGGLSGGNEFRGHENPGGGQRAGGRH